MVSEPLPVSGRDTIIRPACQFEQYTISIIGKGNAAMVYFGTWRHQESPFPSASYRSARARSRSRNAAYRPADRNCSFTSSPERWPRRRISASRSTLPTWAGRARGERRPHPAAGAPRTAPRSFSRIAGSSPVIRGTGEEEQRRPAQGRSGGRGPADPPAAGALEAPHLRDPERQLDHRNEQDDESSR